MDSVKGEDQSPIDLLVGEGKKYKTVEDLARSRIEADNFIETLKREKAEAAEARTKAEVELEKLRRGVQREESPNSNVAQSTTQLTEENLQALIDKSLQERERTTTRARNYETIKKHLMDAYGDQAEERLAKQASEMNTTSEKLFEIGSDNPALFTRLFPVNKPKTENYNHGGSNTEVAELNHSSDFSEYDSLREARKKQGLGKFYSDPANFRKLVAAKKQEMASKGLL